MDFSIIIPTYNRQEELSKLLQSIVDIEYDKSKIEVIVVDQNDCINLIPMIDGYSNMLNIHHIKTPIKGIAHAKNMGIKNASGAVLTFADDDMLYYPDTLKEVSIFFTNNDVPVVVGRVFDREKNRALLRKFPDKPKTINYFSMMYSYIAIACFTKLKEPIFNERFGVGTQYGVGEEWDYLFNLFKRKIYPVYTPSVEVWHPDVAIQAMSKSKIYYYAVGFGAVVREHLNIKLFVAFCSSLLFNLISMLAYFFKIDFTNAQKRAYAFAGRIIGFLYYKK